MNRTIRFLFILVHLSMAMFLLSVVGCSSVTNNSAGQEAPSDKRQANSPGQPAVGKDSANSVELYVLAAASLADAMKELTPIYESSHPGQKLVVSYGSSGTLQQQMEQGAPADVFISAASMQMNALLQKNLIDSEQTSDLLLNQLVLVIPKDAKAQVGSFADLINPDIKKIAIGHPESVPAGTYAKQSLQSLKLWDSLEPKFVYAKDVRQVLSYVETGNADAGIVYKTDAAASDKVTVAAIADEKSHMPIVYPIGVAKNSKHPKEAATLYNWLREPEATAVFAKYGFEAAVKK